MARANTNGVSDASTGEGMSPDEYDKDDPRYEVAKQSQAAREADQRQDGDKAEDQAKEREVAWPGNSSSTSGDSKKTDTTKSETSPRKRAQ